MAIINWTTQALADLEAIGDFIARDTSSFAEVFVDRVFQTVERLEMLNEVGLHQLKIARLSSDGKVMKFLFFD